MTPSSRKMGAAGTPVRVQGVTTEQTVKDSPGVLQRIVLSDGGAAATLTIKDGATTLIVINVPANTAAPVVLEFGMAFSSLLATPSTADVDALFIID